MTTINTPEDFLRALRENPEWREAVRAQILGDELLNLPAALQALTETVNRFIAKQETFNDEQRQFSRNTLARFDRMEGDISTLKGNYALQQVVSGADIIAMDLGLEYVGIMTPGELHRIALMVAEGQALSGDLISFQEADLVIIASELEEIRYMAVEVSYTADTEDTRRAIRNARVMEEQTGHPALPVIASVRNTREVQDEIDSGQVYWHALSERTFNRG